MEGGAAGVGHEVVISNRERLVVRGVRHVESFDEAQAVLDTEMGVLTLRGQGFQIRQLDLDNGSFCVDGLLTSLEYSTGPRETKARNRGFLDRLLK